MNQTLGQSALVGFVLSLAVHVCVLFGIDIAGRFPMVWVLEIGLFALVVPAIFSLVQTLRDGPDPARTPRTIPTWTLVIGLGLFAYAFCNVAYFVYCAAQDGNPELGGGNFLPAMQGKVVHAVALTTYTALRTNLLRAVSGHWLLFYFIAFAYFSFWRKSGAGDDEGARKD